MTAKQIEVQRWSVVSGKPFESVLAAVEAAVGHPDLRNFARQVSAARSHAELTELIQPMLGGSGLMEFARFDLGAVLAKSGGPQTPRSLRLLVGNPLIMEAMVRHVPDAGSYAPVTLLIDERPDGVHLSYDAMASLLAPYGETAALAVARELDARIEKLLTAAAAM